MGSAPEIPEELAARYEVLREVGDGVSAMVFEARDRELDRRVALKILRESAGLADPAVRERFAQEAGFLARHPHEALVPILDEGVDGDPPYLVLGWMPGGDLEAVAARGAAPLADVLEIGIRVAEGLAHLHREGILHRDVKLGNLLLDEEGRARLGDLGLGKVDAGVALTATGYVVGTPAYMAPELLERGEYTPRTDLYALGVCLLELALGRSFLLPAHVAIEEGGVLEAVDDPGLREVLTRVLALDPEARLPEGDALAGALADLRDRSAPAAGAGAATLRSARHLAPSLSSSSFGAAMPREPERDRRGMAAAVFLALAGVLASFAWDRGGGPEAAGPGRAEAPPPLPALERALRAHRRSDGTLAVALGDGDYLDHEGLVVGDLHDPRAPIAWKRIYQELASWSAGYPTDAAGRAALDEAVGRHVLDPFHHLACDQMLGRVYVFRVSTPLAESIAGPPRGAARGRTMEEVAAIQARQVEIRDLAREALREVPVLRDPPGPWSTLLRLRIQGLLADQDLQDAIRLARDRARRAPTPELRARFLSAGLTAFPSAVHVNPVDCPTREEFFREALEFVRDPPPGVDRARLVEIAVDLVGHRFTTERCLEDPEVARESLTLPLHVTERYFEAAPEFVLQILVFSSHQRVASSGFLAGHTVPGLDTLMERVDALVTRTREVLRARVPGQ